MKRSALLAGLFLLSASGWIPLSVGCSSPSAPPPPGDPQLRKQVLRQLGEEVILPELEAFQEAASELVSALQGGLGTPEEPPAEARVSFADAMEIWQRLELMQLGPLAPMSRGGDDFRDEIYSWPVRNTCRVDQALAKEEYEDPQALAEEAVNARGLDALEHLLFSESPENTCASTIDINADGTWDALSEAEISARRLTYALAVAELVLDQAERATAAYSSEDGGFITELARAGNGSTVYPSSQDAFNDWAESLFYLDLQVKDMKLGEPAGIQECAISQCLVELPASGLSVQAIRQNIESFDLQFFGGPRPADGPGLDDLLVDLNQGALAQQMGSLLDDAHAAAGALDDSLEQAITDSPEEVQTLYDAVKAVMDLFETEVFSVLSLELPDAGASDTD